MKLYPFYTTVHDCEKATRLSVKKEEGKLSVTEKLQLFYHLLWCHVCRRFVKQIRRINSMGSNYHQAIQTNPPYTLPPESKEKMLQEIEKHL